jgi:1-aminocyclopropane-1-carboxylate deaminase
MIQHLPSFSIKDVPVDVLRLDLLHPVVSGNKWFKLKYYLQDAAATGKTVIASFGGAYSNHIVATAYAAKQAGLGSIGYIRGDEAVPLSPTLRNAAQFGMRLVFVDRERYRKKQEIILENEDSEIYWIMEGGYGILGAKGASDILSIASSSQYTDILCAIGTGTMMAGLIKSARPHQQVTGISVLKNNFNISESVKSLLNGDEQEKKFSILHDYHFGGYAKHPSGLIDFMKETWLSEQLPTDIVYTAKLLYAAKDLAASNHFPPGSKILVVHSGGLQGNLSLQPGTLPFDTNYTN